MLPQGHLLPLPLLSPDQRHWGFEVSVLIITSSLTPLPSLLSSSHKMLWGGAFFLGRLAHTTKTGLEGDIYMYMYMYVPG